MRGLDKVMMRWRKAYKFEKNIGVGDELDLGSEGKGGVFGILLVQQEEASASLRVRNAAGLDWAEDELCWASWV